MIKKSKSKQSISLEESIDEDRRKDNIIQSLLQQSTNLKINQLPTIKFDLNENQIQANDIIYNSKKKPQIEYITPQIVQNNLEMVKENLKIVIQEKFEESKCLNWLQLVVEFIKVMAYCNVLISDGCSNQKTLWFFLMFIHDIAQIAIIIKIVNTIPAKFDSKLKTKRLTKIKRESKYPMAGRISYYGQLMSDIDQVESQMDYYNDQASRSIKYHSLQQFNQIFYLILVIWGILQLGQLCQSFIVVYTFQGEIIQNLTKQTKSNYEFEICYLCSMQIKHLTQYIDLPCNQLHRFHEKCIQKWLSSHLCCPVCLEPIDLMNLQMKVLA
ncbi:unnamed protein product (macronuclear) [Paramecium tetraurelia]|uniref:RING-type domain-containing protein n=1 Tax=Paramecium tetraurelia TaxID=5888 RepID=A0BMC3_PARTE|nr:uncharacterized protein GSPATT00030326001 [Paramecium tetraurelia]CAK59690.1 unnamed protein product [Paramecium tetraurelia]|eukprot:XP_001427088.1 hypothetical protein (macronuclear) [Paramecium tetraurelia strain d4-2]